MVYEEIDLYEYFSLPRENKTGGKLTAYIPSRNGELKSKSRPAMLVVPGGGYQCVSEREGEPVALRFLSRGYCAFVLNYTVKTAFPVPFLEACMAMAYIRGNAEKYGADRAHVGAIGFSAGGHLAGTLATLFDDDCVKKALGANSSLVRPDAVVLSYPVVTSDETCSHRGSIETVTGGDGALRRKLSLENRVTEKSSPAFVWHTADDDCVPVENSFRMARAYREKGVPFELHIFRSGVHGLSLSNIETSDGEGDVRLNEPVAIWADLVFPWLESFGFKVTVIG